MRGYAISGIGSVLLAAAAAWAQLPSGVIVGTVRDPSGAALAGATVAVKNAEANSSREVSTDLSGAFKVANLAPGAYEITVSKTGFRPLRERNVQVEVGRTIQLALVLEVGSVSETVDVPAGTTPVEVENGGTTAELLTFAELADIIQDSRTVTDLGYLVSGVARRASGGLGSGFVIGGARADNTNFIVDGFSDYDPRTGGTQAMPNYDAVQEFRVQTTGSVAEYGRLAGGVMNMVLRSGTNQPHGDIFEYFRSDRLGARNFFDLQKSHLLSNQFGGTVSGPVVLPRLYNGKDRTFFLVSWEALRMAAGGNRLAEVPTALERAGDFSQSVNASGGRVTVKDPLTGTPFAGNRLPATRIDPIAQALAAFYPLPNTSDPANNYHADASSVYHWDNVLLKLDEHASDKDDLSFRYLTRINSNFYPYTGSDLGSFGSHVNNRPTLAGASYTRVFGPSLVNEFRAGLVRTSDHETGAYAGQNINALVGLSPVATDPHLVGFPRFTILNLATLGDWLGMPVDYTVNNYEVAEAVSLTHGRHLVKFGVDLLRTQFFQQLNYNNRGNFNFLGRWSNVPFADFLLGLPDSTSRQTSSSSAYLFATNVGFFVQDQYSISSWLTLSYGLRYEAVRPPYEKYGRISSFVPEIGKLVIASGQTLPDLAQRVDAAGLTGRVTTARDAGLPNAMVYPNSHNLAPRFGFALRPGGRQNFVVRGGYGIYYADSLLNPIRNDLTNVYPFTVSQTFNRVSGQPPALTLENPFPDKLASLPGVTNVNGFELHPRPQYLQSYTLSVERQVGQDTTIELEYAGSRGTHLERQYNLNQPYRTLATRLPNGTFLRPFAGFGTINFYSFGSNSVYSSGSLTVRRRWRKGFFYGLTYVYSKSIDNASQVSGNSVGDFPGVQDSRDLRAERGRSDWDTGHSLLVFGAYSLPFRSNWMTKGWQVATTARLYTGQPFTPRVANANISLGEAGRPDRIAKGTLPDAGVAEWFDLTAFPVVPRTAYRFGDSGRNILDGPGSIYWNVAVMKNIRFLEKGRAQLRCEAINVLNHANFGLPVDYVDALNAGQILSADSGRSIQLGLRLWF